MIVIQFKNNHHAKYFASLFKWRLVLTHNLLFLIPLYKKSYSLILISIIYRFS